MNTEHLVNRVPDAVNRLRIDLLTDTLAAGLKHVPSHEATRTVTLYQNDSTIKAELTITLCLNVVRPVK